MKNVFSRYSVDLTEEKLKKFEFYGEFLLAKNKEFNLTAAKDVGELWIKHFLDSCLGEKFFVDNARCLDVGAGGGFPSVPLKIIRDDLDFTLLEATGKKCEFLREVSKGLGFEKVNVVCARAEDAAKSDMRESFDAVTARAVARLNTLCEYCLPFVKVGGRFIAYKGRADEEIEEAKNAIGVLGGQVETVEKFSLPDNIGEREIIVIKKVKQTPAAYPRGNGKERKKPL